MHENTDSGKKQPKTIDEYIAAQPGNVQLLLTLARVTLRAALPYAEERISWRMPTFWNNRNLIHFAAFKNHIGIYPGGEVMEEFAPQLTEYKTSKGALQLPLDRPLPVALIAAIAKRCGEMEREQRWMSGTRATRSKTTGK